MRGSDCILLVCDGSNTNVTEEIETLRNWYKEVCDNTEKDIKLVSFLVAVNKMDLAGNQLAIPEEISKWCSEHNPPLKCLPTSAKSGFNVEQIFTTLLTQQEQASVSYGPNPNAHQMVAYGVPPPSSKVEISQHNNGGSSSHNNNCCK